MSPEQIEANRRNAQHSTGPRTPEGRAVSKMNALKHGILSKQVLVHGLNIKESSRAYAALHQRFVAELHPIGPVEEMLVDQIVTAHWRLRRALKAESGEVALSVDAGAWKRKCQPSMKQQLYEWRLSADPIHAMKQSASGSLFVLQSLSFVLREVERVGELTEKAVQYFLLNFDGFPNELTDRLEGLRQRLAQNPDNLDYATLRAKRKEEALAWLSEESKAWIDWHVECGRQERVEEEARQAAAMLPPLETMERVLRYETKLERQIFRAMNQLERLQRMRQGEAISAPLTMDVSGKEAE